MRSIGADDGSQENKIPRWLGIDKLSSGFMKSYRP